MNGLISCQVQRAFLPTAFPMYVMGKTLWDDTLQFEELAKDYFEHAFGEDGLLCKEYLSQLSAAFNPPYLRNETEQISREAAEEFSKIPNIIQSFSKTMRKNLQHEDKNISMSWRYLEYHANICSRLASILVCKASGDNEEMLKLWFSLKECSQEDFHLLSSFYDKEEVKFIRDKQRFIDLANRVPSASVFDHIAKFFCVEENGQMQGYFICAVIPKENGDLIMEVIEYAGKRKAVLAGILKTMVQLNITVISGYTSWFDTDMVKALEDYKINLETCNYPGTMRIINFTQFMQKLKPLFAQEKMIEDIEFCEADGKYMIRSGNMELVIDNDKTMHNLLLGNDMELLETEHISGDDMLQLILPIPVPYPYNLNYI